MAIVNEHFSKLKAGYLFPEIQKRVQAFSQKYPDKSSQLIACGIGDVTEALPQAACEAMKQAVDELGKRETFRGYGSSQGYDFLREAITENDYEGLGIEADEIFISDGSKCDAANILDLFGRSNRIAVTDPVYPVYVDTNVMVGNTGEALNGGGYEGLVYLAGSAENGFVPEIPQSAVDIIYLCYPNNPTGTVATKEQLQAWVNYALEHQAILLFDAAYEAFIQDLEIPHSIYEIEGASQCAIEFRSFSKNGGFTGVRCGFTVVPKSLKAFEPQGTEISLHQIWNRRQNTKFNGVSYPVQRGAEALYTSQGKKQVAELIQGYMGNASLLKGAIESLGLKVFGGKNAPYIWVECPKGLNSWGIFDALLEKIQVIVTPGAGFGEAGESYFRISAFNSRQNILEVCRRLKDFLELS